MDDQLRTALARRLAAYSATAGVTLAAAPAGAQIVYTDLDPDILVNYTNETQRLDIDDDGWNDLTVFYCTSCFFENAGRVSVYKVGIRLPPVANTQNGAFGYPSPRYGPGVGAVSRLTTGDVVGPAGAGQGFYANANVSVVYLGVHQYNWRGAEGYVGFRFVGADDALHYGWLRLRASAYGATLFEFAYESAPETPIVAGDGGPAAPAVTIGGDVNQTVFPPEGGVLVFTGTATNYSAFAVPVDFWISTLDPNGAPLPDRRLASGTLPGETAVTRQVSLNVPATAAPGTYQVTFNVGDFDTREAHDAVTFFITKLPEAPLAPRDGVERDGAPVTGDLFAEAAVTPEGSPGTHALSAAAPNPFSGQTTFTLEVAETQIVRVEVMDALGRRVATLHDGTLEAGTAHRLVFDGSALPSGVYAVRAVGERFTDVRTLTLVR
jgi:hypothetical protein